MDPLVDLVAQGDPEIKKRFKAAVNLSVKFSEALPGQFKLIETPINSFLLVTNVLPNDKHTVYNPVPKLDFSNIKLPRLQKLNRICGYELENEPQCFKMNVTIPKNMSLCYDSLTWKKALQLDKTDLIQTVMEQMSDPKNWIGEFTEDPFPLVWLLFYGPKSFCEMEDCLYLKKMHRLGPILFPPSMYKPNEDISSFMNHLCYYVKVLYYNKDLDLPEIIAQVSRDRLFHAIAKLKALDDSCAYISKKCLICHLYCQNEDVLNGVDISNCPILISGESGQYINDTVTIQRTCGGDTFLVPLYNIDRMLEDLPKIIHGTD
ncbi:putative member of UL95 family [Marmot herpesvirus 1]|nr:putative member of UL95 family [Marmot herpesvirus 1]